jgi:hypothetical protein
MAGMTASIDGLVSWPGSSGSDTPSPPRGLPLSQSPRPSPPIGGPGNRIHPGYHLRRGKSTTQRGLESPGVRYSRATEQGYVAGWIAAALLLASTQSGRQSRAFSPTGGQPRSGVYSTSALVVVVGQLRQQVHPAPRTGRFQFVNLAPGKYTISVGHTPMSQSNCRIGRPSPPVTARRTARKSAGPATPVGPRASSANSGVT